MLVEQLKKNRKFMPIFPPQKMKKGEVIFYTSGNLLCIKWCDKREVLMLTTRHGIGMIETGKEDRKSGEKLLKPIAVTEYNTYMGAIDKTDMLLSSVKSVRKSVK